MNATNNANAPITISVAIRNNLLFPEKFFNLNKLFIRYPFKTVQTCFSNGLLRYEILIVVPILSTTKSTYEANNALYHHQ